MRAVISGIKVNARADVLEYADYYALGGVARSGGTMQYRHGYQGQYAEKDGETGWNSFELRQYDAVIGRWLSPDPYGQYNSPYVAMGNDWVNMVDPDGGWTDPIISATTNLVGTATDMTKIILEFKEVVITATRVGSGALGSGVGNALSAVSGAWNGMSTLDQVQTVVDVAGFIPGVNVVSSLVSAGIDVYKGDYGGAALNLAGIIPGAKAAIVLVTVGTAAVRAAKVLKVAKGATIIKQTSKKTDYLLSNRSDAMNWARNRLGHNTDKMYDASGKWIGWSNSKGSVYWGHGDWGKGVGSSKFPHLNYNIDGKKGHLFLQNKIINRGAWGDFTNHFGI